MKVVFQVNADAEARGKQAQSHGDILDVASRAEEDLVLLPWTQNLETNREVFL